MMMMMMMMMMVLNFFNLENLSGPASLRIGLNVNKRSGVQCVAVIKTRLENCYWDIIGH